MFNQKHILKYLLLGLLAALSIYVFILINVPPWVLYIGWSTYMLFSKTITNILVSLLEETAGMILGYLMKLCGVNLNIPHFGLLISGFVLGIHILY